MDLENKMVMDYYGARDMQDYEDKVVAYCPCCGSPVYELDRVVLDGDGDVVACENCYHFKQAWEVYDA